MTIGTKIYSTLETSRLLESYEIKQFNKLKYVTANEFILIEKKVYPSLLNFDYINKWLYYKGNLFINNFSDEYFFIETLEYLIRVFFKPKGIIINGCITGYEDIFGTFFCYRIENNVINVDTIFLNYLESITLDTDILKNLELVYEKIIKPYNYNYLNYN